MRTYATIFVVLILNAAFGAPVAAEVGPKWVDLDERQKMMRFMQAIQPAASHDIQGTEDLLDDIELPPDPLVWDSFDANIAGLRLRLDFDLGRRPEAIERAKNYRRLPNTEPLEPLHQMSFGVLADAEAMAGRRDTALALQTQSQEDYGAAPLSPSQKLLYAHWDPRSEAGELDQIFQAKNPMDDLGFMKMMGMWKHGALTKYPALGLDAALVVCEEGGEMDITAVYARLLEHKGSLVRLRVSSSPEEIGRQLTEQIGAREEGRRGFPGGLGAKGLPPELIDVMQGGALPPRTSPTSPKVAATEGTLEARELARQLGDLLPPDTALLDFVEYGHTSRVEPVGYRYGVFISRNDRPTVFRGLGSSTPIHDAVDAWLTVASSFQHPTAAGQRLKRLIWDAISEDVEGCDTLLVSPDARLHFLPFVGLPGENGNRYLIQSRRVVTLPYVTEELLTHKSGGLPVKMLLVGDIDYGLVDPQDPMSYSPLAHATERMNKIEQVAMSAPERVSIRRMGGKRVTRERLLKSLPKVSWAHFSTHGNQVSADDITVPVGPGGNLQMLIGGENFMNEMMQRSNWVLALSDANSHLPFKPKDSAGLTSDDIDALNLENMDTAVLTACETQLGLVASGELPYGLQRAFLAAGAKSVVSTLWQVPDLAAGEIALAFYRYRFTEGHSKAEALRLAQLDFLTDGNTSDRAGRGPGRLVPMNRQASVDVEQASGETDGVEETDLAPPAFWAGYTLTGEWR